MPLLKLNYRNLVGGVSQQPVAVRRENQGAVATNLWPSAVDGIVKRPPTQHVADLGTSPGVWAHHWIHRDADEQYLVAITTTGITVTDLSDGSNVPVVDLGGAGWSYLTNMNEENIRAVTVADTTFITNLTVPVAAGSTTASSTPTGADDEAYIFVRQGNYSVNYNCRIGVNGTDYTAQVQTWDGSVNAGGELESIKTDDIVAELKTVLDALSIPNTTITVEGSVLRIVTSSTWTIDYVTVDDSVGDSVMVAYQNEVPQVQGYLPEIGYNGFKIKVIGTAEIDGDDYWVEFVADEGASSFSKGYWRETVAPGTVTDLDNTTMPHQLIRTYNGVGNSKQFEWGVVTWGDRLTGDSTSNPMPSFVGRNIRDIFFYKNRLGFVAEDRVILSEAGEYYNFFRVTLLTLRDTAPIDVQIAHAKITQIENAIPYNEDVILFSDRSQFILRGSEILSPRTVQVIPVSEYENTKECRPIPSGRSVFFAFKRGSQSGIRELFQVGDTLKFDGFDTTDHVPNYIEGDVVQMTVSSLEDTLVARSDTERNTLWIYKFYWSGNEKLQSAWCKWTIGAEEDTVPVIRGAFFIENTLYVTLARADGFTYIEKMELSTGLSDGTADFVVHLDRRVTQADVTSLTYSAANGSTTFTLPYDPDNNADIAVIGEDGVAHEVLSVSSATVTVRDDISALNFFVGQNYTMTFEMNPPLVKTQSGNGVSSEYHPAQQVMKGFLQYHATRYFTTTVKTGQRKTYTYTFNGMALDDGNDVVDSIVLQAGEFQFPVRGSAQDTTITILNSTPYPSNIMAASWHILYRSKARPLTG